MDVDTVGRNAELNYESINTGIESFHNLFCVRCWTVSDSLYCVDCDYSKDCFGCVGMRRHQHCILNKQYTPEEYQSMQLRILDHMRDTGEWGEFFPTAESPFCYNETVAQEYFPLAKEAALSRGFRWREPEPREYRPATCAVPDSIEDASESICKEMLACAACRKNYRVIREEFKACRERGIPIAQFCPDCRHLRRMKLRNPRDLWSRECDKCGAAVQSSFAPERPEIVYCGKCYTSHAF